MTAAYTRIPSPAVNGSLFPDARRPRLCHLDRSHPQRLSYPSLCFMRVSRLCSSLRFSRCWGNSGSTDISRTTGVPPRWAAETIWIPKVESLLRHRESSGDASVRLAVARMCLVAVALDDQPHRHRSHPPLHAFRGHFTHPPHSRSNTLLRLPLPDTFLYPRPNRHQVLEVQRRCSRSIATISHPISPFHQKPQMNRQSSSFWSSQRSGEFRLCSNCSGGGGAHTTRYYCGTTHPGLRGHLIKRGVCKGDTRCISWKLKSATDPDVILSTVRSTAGA